MNKKTLFLKIAIIVAVIIPTGYYIFFRFNFPPCTQYESRLKIPNILKDSYIIFEEPMEYKNIIDSQYTTCNTSEKLSRGKINRAVNYRNSEYVSSKFSYNTIKNGTKFKILKYYELKCTFCWEFFNQHQLLLENEMGDKYTINVHDLEPNVKSISAGYYKNEIRLGDISSFFNQK